MMKKILLPLLLIVMVFTLAVPAMADSNTFRFDKTVTELFVGGTLQTVLERGGKAANGEVTYTSSAYKVATVDENGVVTGLKEGTTTITARVGNYKATIRLEVLVPVESMVLNTDKIIVFAQEDPAVALAVQQIPEDTTPVLVMRDGQSKSLAMIVTPGDASSKKVRIVSSDEEILRVRGYDVTARNVGECWLTITSVQNPEVSVKYRMLVVEPVKSFNIEAGKQELFIGEQTQLTTTVKPANATIQTFTWVSSNEEVATVDEFGVVTAHKKGTAYITGEAMDGSKAEDRIKITVNQQPRGVRLEQTKMNINIGSPKTLEATVLPASTSDKSVTWHSSNTKIATVSSSGKVTAVAPGTCIITVRCKDFPELSATCEVTVKQPVTKIQINNTDASFDIGTTMQLDWTVLPANATHQRVTFSSSKESVATVDENGLVTGLKKGTATITVTATDAQKKTGTIKVTVTQPVKRIKLADANLTVNVGTTKTLKATVSPSDADNKKVTWKSSNTSIATVSSSGKITPVAPGNCIITCTSRANPEVSAACQVTVLQPVKKVVFSGSSVSLDVGTTRQLKWSTEPFNASNPTVTFSSSNTKVAKVDANGVVRGVKRGSATITATAADGSKKKDTIKVNVLQPVLGVHMYSDNVRVGVDKTLRLRAVFEPEDASNTNMNWYSSDTTIATVRGSNNRPTVTGKAWGTAIISGITEDGGYITNCTVNVGDYDRALRIQDLYLQNNEIKITTYNESNLFISNFNIKVEVYDIYNQPLPCTTNGGHIFRAGNSYTLDVGESTRRGSYYFFSFVQPKTPIGRLVAYVTDYVTGDGYSHKIRYEEDLEKIEYISPLYLGPDALPKPEEPKPEEPKPQEPPVG